MNDRFKFRVWDKRRNKFIESPEPTPMLQANGLLAYFKDAEYMNNYVIQFSTGLKDKNGKLIYEGDVVKTKYTTPSGVDMEEICTVNFGRCAFWINYGYCAFYLDNENCIYEVIGNIYENKELLQESEVQN